MELLDMDTFRLDPGEMAGLSFLQEIIFPQPLTPRISLIE